MARKKTKRKNRSGMLPALLIAAAVIILGGACTKDYLGVRADSGASPAELREVTVPPGASVAEIAAVLKQQGIIRYPTFFRIVSRLGGHDTLYKQGTFALRANADYPTVFKTLSNPAEGQANSIRVTIPEGFEFRQIADRLAEQGLIDKDTFYRVAEQETFDFDFISKIPKRENRLEGYLFPDTYSFVKGSDTEKTIIHTMLARFEEVVCTADNIDRANELGMSMDEIVTLASLIEREALGDSDRKDVSSVFHNRLKSRDFPYLQSCATVQYILRERKPVLSEADTKINSPYNTYRNKGLPVGPIASPGAKAVEAALYPNQTDYLFFVLGSDGTHHFSKTYDEHLANMKK